MTDYLLDDALLSSRGSSCPVARSLSPGPAVVGSASTPIRFRKAKAGWRQITVPCLRGGIIGQVPFLLQDGLQSGDAASVDIHGEEREEFLVGRGASPLLRA